MQSKSQVGLTGKARDTLAKILDHVLRDECSLSATTREYRWRLAGPNLYSLHRLFDEQRRQLDFWLSQVIERTRSIGLGGVARIDGSGDNPAPKASGEYLPPRTVIGDLLARHEALAHRLREDIQGLHDPTTAELLKHLAEFHETSAWMLRMVHGEPGAEQPA